MESSHQLAQRLQELIFDGKWIANTNYKEQINDLDWRSANQKFKSLNSIALLTYHMNYYIAGVLKVFEGGDLDIKDKYSFDMAALDSNENWENLLDEFWTNSKSFISKIKELKEEQLDAIFVKKQYGTYRRNIEAMIEHGYYHLGQIVLINKMIKQ